MDDELRKRIAEAQKAYDQNKGLFNAAKEIADGPAARTIREFSEGSAARVIQETIASQRAWEETSGIRRLIEEMNARDNWIQAIIGPLDDIQQFGAAAMARLEENPLLSGISASDLVSREVMEQAQGLLSGYEAQFHLPAASEIANLLTGEGAAAAMLQRYGEEPAYIRQAMEIMRTPWLDAQEAAQSVAGFAGIQSIGHALAAAPAFNDALTAALRVDLGDWRDNIIWPESIFTDVIARADFYAARGFDSSLTNFPVIAFRETVEIAGLRDEPLALEIQYGPPVPAVDGEQEEGFVRTNTAHDWLQRFETRLRHFIDTAMTAAYGPKWAKGKLPNGVYEKWQEKKRVAEEAGGQEYPLIAYADFTDYVEVICRRDNWREIFERYFERPESVRESFQRLYPIRICTMHARAITQDDELLLYIEVKRLINAIS